MHVFSVRCILCSSDCLLSCYGNKCLTLITGLAPWWGFFWVGGQVNWIQVQQWNLSTHKWMSGSTSGQIVSSLCNKGEASNSILLSFLYLMYSIQVPVAPPQTYELLLLVASLLFDSKVAEFMNLLPKGTWAFDLCGLKEFRWMMETRP